MKHSILLLSLAIVVLVLAACNGENNAAQVTATTATLVGPDTAPEVTASPAATTRALTASPSPTPLAGATATSQPATPTRPSPTPSPALTPAATEPAPSPAPSPTPAATSTATPAADPAAVALQLEAVVGGLTNPSGIVSPGDGSGRLFVLEQPGRIRVVEDGRLLDAPFLDIVDRVTSRGNEQGLLGLAFHPRYRENGRFFVNYTRANGDTVISSWLVSQDPNRADLGSESLVLAVEQPAANHNGGHLAFGPDGYLYIGLGDGGGGGDTYGNGQNGATLLGAMLRLDIDGAAPYTIPGDNPFLDDPAVRDEIWAVGLRNPWRYSFDRLTGDLYIADVGQNSYEEVNFQPATSSGGENYGWPILEGNHCLSGSGCNAEGMTMPIWEYDHAAGCSVTGGYVYRGSRYPILQGIYVVGDYCSGTFWGLARGAEDNWRSAILAGTDIRLTSFGEDEEGELYLVDRSSGTLYHLAAQPRR
jgi:glucose/arabinose dehydrogenase